MGPVLPPVDPGVAACDAVPCLVVPPPLADSGVIKSAKGLNDTDWRLLANSVIVFMPYREGWYTKSLQVIVSHFLPQNYHNNHLATIKLIHFPDAPDKK